ncbi:MAG: hypothetical protein JWN70_2359 [Planctomycetaceae bacterium]|nr:hypothetical protein [Planctomycetaceae bacterium]
MTFENETWLIETSDQIIEKKSTTGIAGLTPLERLIYCVWVADYGMRNAGDLDTASDLYPDFHVAACELAKTLSLPYTSETFLLDSESLTSQYFERFDGICNELKNA